MPALAFILGREPHLSVAEIAAVVGNGADWGKAALSREALVIPVAEAVDAHALMSRLGGSIKIGEVWREIPPDGFDGNDDAIGKFLLEHSSDVRKVHFGYSVYDLGGGAMRTAAIRRSITRGAAAQKAWLTERGRKVRWVMSREATLSSVVVATNDLLPERNGMEVVALVGAASVMLVRTLAVQPFEEWGDRDFGRPKRDARSGMLPPKLARIMLNLVLPRVVRDGTSMWDPFCGSGTVLNEAMQLGVSRIIGTDASPAAIRDATTNVAWMAERVASTHAMTMTVCDVRAASKCVRERVDAIVTEPYLGPPSFSLRDIPKIQNELRTLYIDAFREFANVLARGGRVAFIMPEFAVRSVAGTSTPRAGSFDISNDVRKFGFQRIAPFPPILADDPLLRDAKDLPYARPDQRVGRRILLFVKT